MLIFSGIDQLGGDPYLLPGFAYTPFYHVLHPHLTADVPDLYRLALVGKSRVAGDDKQAGDFGEIGGDVFSDAVAEVLLLGIITHVDKGQDEDGGLVRQWQP